ncbi:MAG: hypothetical protein JWQ25_1575 [Daejeonella sp.]|nr:hypothetical protein [Daejeonella sp.]
MINKKSTICFSLIVACFISKFATAQSLEGNTQTDGKTSNTIQTAVPFLLVAPDARSGAMGDAGVAISPDANSIHWNPAKMAFVENPVGISLSYTPWLRKLVPDIDLAYLSGYKRLDSRNTVGGSLRYFSLGTIIFTQDGENGTPYSPNEFAIDGFFARQFGENFSLGTSLRYIRSVLGYGEITSSSGNSVQAQPASAVAADISAYFRKGTVLFGTDAETSFGINISNIGTKVSYSSGGQKSFLPTNMKLGAATTFNLDDYNKFTVALDLNKLLVPTNPLTDVNGNIIKGKDPNRSVPSGIFGSFSDAPGGFSEEMKEISYSIGSEYWYNKQFAIRAGYFYENPLKGDRQYFTTGLGLKYNVFNLDVAYLLANQQKSPLAQTLRFTLIFNFEKKEAANTAP